MVYPLNRRGRLRFRDEVGYQAVVMLRFHLLATYVT